ncbi:serine/threonine protein kinase [Streptomyces sp. AJS327]|uniref:serine/threonine-protein kinase n=1 Tax=Streptomyces sp. AJS327 TaxID=2545265 RepID=UPI0015DFE3CF|nr:serine/threonine-protein kinase [Streptomyces sp. AJS327]MBA0054150.1 serine/threonine protein kinase [Streptomyces sp. AJS327]
MSEDDAGRLVGGRYRLEEVLGRGGMGTVWRSRDEILGRTVAVKELRFPSSVEEEEKQRLITRTLREAKAIARIRSGSAITVFDVVDEDDRPWIVMELIEGISLAEHILDHGPLEAQRAAEVGLAILDVLRAAHREGILHRDVKPSNVLLEEGTGRVVLTDFGIAKVEGDPSVTSTGMLVGAPSYISPERARGKPPGPPADLWSLGGLLYAAVEGRPPYDKGSAISTLTAVMTEPVPPAERAAELDEVIRGLLIKDPDQRLGVDEARALLEPVASGAALEARGAEGSTTRVLPTPGADSGSGRPSEGRPAADRLRGALKSVRNATAGAAASAGGSGSGASGRAPSSRSAPDRASTPSHSKAVGEKTPSSGTADQGARGTSGGTRAAAPSGGGPEPVGSITSLRDLREVPELRRNVSRRTLVIVAAVVALMVALGAMIAAAASGGDDKGNESASSGGSGDTSPTPGKDESPGDERDGDGGDSGKDDAKPSDKPAKPKLPRVPDDFKDVVDDRFNFRMAMPDGWKRTGVAGANSGGKYSKPGGGYPRIQVDYNSRPGANAAAAWRGLEPAVRKASNDYRRLSLRPVDWRNYPTVADWQFTRTEGGTKVRVLNRGFKVDGGRGYAIMITCPADAWTTGECRQLRQSAFRSFAPK